MAQNLTIAGASYEDVPSISVAKTGGGYASFMDTSDGDAVAEDVIAGKICYANGSRIVGSGSGGGGTTTKHGLTIDDLLGDLDGSNQLLQPTGADTDLVFSGVAKMVTYALHYKFSRNLKIRTATFPALTTLSTSYAMQYAFNNATNLTSVSFPALTTISGSNAMANCFYGCSGLTTASFPEVTTVTGSSACQYLFYNCTNLTSVDFSKLKTIGNSSATSTTNRQFYYAFAGATKMTSITFSALESIYCNGTANSYGTFSNNNKVKKFYFPKLSTIAKTTGYTATDGELGVKNIFYNCTALTEIHFALTNKTAIESTLGYGTKWGAPSGCSILFDL